MRAFDIKFFLVTVLILCVGSGCATVETKSLGKRIQQFEDIEAIKQLNSFS